MSGIDRCMVLLSQYPNTTHTATMVVSLDHRSSETSGPHFFNLRRVKETAGRGFLQLEFGLGVSYQILAILKSCLAYFQLLLQGSL